MKKIIELIRGKLFLSIVICFLCVVLFEVISYWNSNNKMLVTILGILSNVSLSLATSFFMLGFVESILENYLNSDMDNIVKGMGFKTISRKNSCDDLHIDITNTDNLFIVMNDGKSFINANRTLLEKRFATKKKTVFIFLNMENENNENALCIQAKKDKGYYLSKSKAVIDDIKNLVKKYDCDCVTIYKYDLWGGFKNHIVLTDEQAILGIYRNSQGKSDRPPPTFIYDKHESDDSEYRQIKKDIDDMISCSDLCQKIPLDDSDK